MTGKILDVLTLDTSLCQSQSCLLACIGTVITIETAYRTIRGKLEVVSPEFITVNMGDYFLTIPSKEIIQVIKKG
ncbi:hypothetical protein JOC33_003808 [Thalassobacillus pellis]|nr:hypothetical protein [Thalassobacillus pellis]